MKVEHINPFIESVQHLFSTMLNTEVRRGNLGVAANASRPREITALIGLSGRVRGTVALALPIPTALAMVNRMLDRETRIMDDTVLDGVSEMVNIVAGGAKSKFGGDGPPIDLSLPTIIRGDNYSVDYPSSSTWLEVPFTSDLGSFSLRVTFEVEGKPKKNKTRDTANESLSR